MEIQTLEKPTMEIANEEISTPETADLEIATQETANMEIPTPKTANVEILTPEIPNVENPILETTPHPLKKRAPKYVRLFILFKYFENICLLGQE